MSPNHGGRSIGEPPTTLVNKRAMESPAIGGGGVTDIRRMLSKLICPPQDALNFGGGNQLAAEAPDGGYSALVALTVCP